MSTVPHAGPDSDLPDPFPLVGRSAELAALTARLDDEESEISTIFIRGSGGVGKSRLVSEVVELARARGWTVARGQAYPVESGVSYSLFADAWLPVLRTMDSSTLNVLSRGGLRELSYLFPALNPSDREADDFGEDPEEFRTRLMWNFAEFLESLSRRDPVLCVLEDLQWADESSLQLLHFVSRHASGHPIVVLCTYNDESRDLRPQLVRAERSLESVNVASVLEIRPLTLDAVTELVRRTFGVEADVIREFAAVLYGWTRGNAFFVEEILKSLVTSGRLHKVGRSWTGWDARDFNLPGSIRDAVLERIRGLSEQAQSIAELAAIIGDRVGHSLLEAVGSLGSDETLSALEELCRHRVLDERSEDGDVVYHFAHPLFRETLASEVGLARARRLHGQVAEAMETHYGAAAMEHAAELAYHFSRGVSASSRSKAARYLMLAGSRALDRRADLEAVEYLRSAMERAAEASGSGDAIQAQVAPLLARAYTHLGRYDEAAELWERVMEHVGDDPADAPSLRRTLGMTYFWQGRHDDAHEQLDRGLAIARAAGDDAATVRLLVAKAHCLHEVGRGMDAVETVAPALPLAEALHDVRLQARVHRALALLHVWVGPPEKAELHGERAIELAAKAGDVSIEFWARWGLAVLAGMRGDTERMARAIDQINELADTARSPVLRLWTADMAVELAYARLEWDRGVVEGESAIARARALNQRTLLPRILVWTSQFYVGRGNLDRAKKLVEEAERVSGLDREGPHDVHQVVPTYIGKAHYLVALGDFEDAIEAAEKGLAIAEGTGYILWAMHQCLPVLAEACFWAGRVEKAAEVGRRMREHSERIDHRLGIAWADACEALVRWKEGDPEGSIPMLREAADALEAVPQHYHAARLRRQLSARLRDAGRTEEAKEELDRAWEVFAKVGAGDEKEKARQNYRDLKLRAPTEHKMDGPLGLTPEECEVAKLVAQGMNNPQIAEVRNSARRTISTHVSNMYKKLDLSGPGKRYRLGELVREAGLLE